MLRDEVLTTFDEYLEIPKADTEKFLLRIMKSIPPFGSAEHIKSNMTLLSRFAERESPIDIHRIR